MEYTVKELADLAGVTPRTLRWYDREGLLHPARLTPAGYRLYGPEEVDRLQQVLFYRELGLGLSAIRSLLDDPAYDRQAALQSHLRELEARRARLDALILTVQKTLRDEKGGTRRSDREKFECFKSRLLQEHETAYGAEVRARYGDQEADRAYARLSALTWEEYRSWEALGDRILAELAAAVRSGADPAGEAGAALAELHREWLGFSWEVYTPQAHRGLGELYVTDPRFTAYYDWEGPGCAAFLSRAIAAYTDL